MDKTIGFVIDRPLMSEEREKYVKLLFELIWKNMDEFLHIVNNSTKPAVGLYDGAYYG